MSWRLLYKFQVRGKRQLTVPGNTGGDNDRELSCKEWGDHHRVEKETQHHSRAKEHLDKEKMLLALSSQPWPNWLARSPHILLIFSCQLISEALPLMPGQLSYLRRKKSHRTFDPSEVFKFLMEMRHNGLIWICPFLCLCPVSLACVTGLICTCDWFSLQVLNTTLGHQALRETEACPRSMKTRQGQDLAEAQNDTRQHEQEQLENWSSTDHWKTHLNL